FAGNTLLISPEKLVEDGLLSADDLSDRPDFPFDKADFGAVYKWKSELLPQAFANYLNSGNFELAGRFDGYCRENAFWLDDYALFQAIRTSHESKPWYEWPEGLRMRNGTELGAAYQKLSAEI